MTSIFSDLQESVATLIESDEWIRGTVPISVVTEKRGEVGAQIKERVARNGLVVLVITPKWSSAEVDSSSINVVVRLGVAERVKINRGATGTGKSALDVATSVVALLWNFTPPGGWQQLAFVGATQLDGPDDEVSFEIDFNTSIRVAPTQVTA